MHNIKNYKLEEEVGHKEVEHKEVEEVEEVEEECKG
jgi:hypothetical protein